MTGGFFSLELFLPEDYPMCAPVCAKNSVLDFFSRRSWICALPLLRATPPPRHTRQKVRFLTKIYHPNIDKLGRICLDILKDKWSPAMQIRHVLLSIQALMSTPNPDDPLANDIAEVWKKDINSALKLAREWTAEYARR